MAMFGGPDAPSNTAIRAQWALEKLTPSLEPLVTALLREMPADPKIFMSKFLVEKKSKEQKPAPAAEADDEVVHAAKRTTRRSILSAAPMVSAVPSGTKQLDKDTYLKLRRAFQAADKDGSNSLDVTELGALLNMDSAHIFQLLAKFDPDNDGKVSFQELISCIYHTQPDVEKSEKPEMASGEMFTDPEFPPNDEAVFKTNGYAGDAVEAFRKTIGGSPKWIRASQLTLSASGNAKLFDNIHPNDIAQGNVGDCWLLAGLAGLAEFEGAVLNHFEEKKTSENGMYHIRIFDPVEKKWHVVTIDDWIPCDHKGNPISSKPQGHEMWVLLIEKAFAKWFGSYCMTQGAYCLLPYMLLVDCKNACRQYSQNYKGVAPFNMEEYQGLSAHMTDSHDRTKIALGLAPKVHANELFTMLLKADETNHIMCAWTMKDAPSVGSGASGEHIGADGIVKGHAYSLITAREVQADGQDFKLVQLRNPWGANPASEWKGKFSDNWKDWDKYPELRKELGCGSPVMDGMFWMDWDDFRSRYSDIGVVPEEMAVPKLGLLEHEAHKAGDGESLAYKNFTSSSR